jgi:hypothetical protein
MRIVILALALSLFTHPANAQESPEERQNCYPVAAGGRVEVTTQAGPIRRATLLCIGSEKVVLATDGRVETIPLHDVQAIVKPADGVADGFLKGAAVAGIFSLLCWECGDAGERLAAIVVYGGIGAGIDALHGGSETLYRRNVTRPGPPRATVAWRVRF